MLENRLKPDISKGQTRRDRAAEEAVKAKRCIGALRYLWRNSPNRAHHPAVHEMKSYLKDSPIQQSNAVPAPPSDAGSGGVAPAGSDSHGGSEPEASDHESLPLVALGNGDDHDSYDGDDLGTALASLSVRPQAPSETIHKMLETIHKMIRDYS